MRDTREEQFLDELHNDAIWGNVVCMKFKITAAQLSERIDAFALDMQCQDKTHGTLRDMKSHFTNWLRIQMEYEKNKQQTRTVNYGAEYANNAIGKAAAREAAREQRRKEAYEWIANEINRSNAV